MKPTDVGRLLRLSLAPSAAADAVAGLVFASAGRFPAEPRAWWLVGSSLCVYHGALALNDWNDRAHDARTRPDRPIPAGRVSSTQAVLVGGTLLAVGVALAALVSWSALAWMAGVAALTLLYDFAGRGAWTGPFLLAACRAGNLGAALFVVPRLAHERLEPAAWLTCVAYGAYVFVVSRLGRMEDAEDARELGARPARLLALAACVPIVFVLTWTTLLLVRADGAMRGLDLVPLAAALALALAGSWELFRTSARTRAWTRALVERAMGLCLRRLLVFTAVVTLLAARSDVPDAWIAAAAIVCGYPLAHALRRVFPPS